MNWYCFLTKPQREFDAEYQMERAGLDVFVPYEIRWRYANRYQKSRHRAKRPVRFPLLRGYLFAAFNEAVPWYFILDRHRNVLNGYIANNSQPCRFPQAAIDHLREISATPEPRPWRHMPTHEEFNESDMVKVTEGPLKDQTFRVEEIRGKHARILLEAMGGLVDADIDLWKLARAS